MERLVQAEHIVRLVGDELQSGGNAFVDITCSIQRKDQAVACVGKITLHGKRRAKACDGLRRATIRERLNGVIIEVVSSSRIWQ